MVDTNNALNVDYWSFLNVYDGLKFVDDFSYLQALLVPEESGGC
jgi:hypothetical protein